ncbi:MAG: N-acetyltransferase [Deltaproteobacteria bacterium]|nr:N-acetyltransferase [Deltaproteobacteria bacterium]
MELDVDPIRDIYNHYVLTSTCTFDIEPRPPEPPEVWLSQHPASYPAIVACDGDKVVGWATLSPHRTRCAYQNTVESSVYIHRDQHRRGIGRQLMKDLVQRAATLGHHTILAGIADHQQASLRLHEALGFTSVGCLREVGYKFGRWIDVDWMQLLFWRES